MKQVDPAAKQLLDRMVASHQALFSFSAQLNVEAVSDSRKETTQASLVYMKPNKVRLELKQGNAGRIVAVCDGNQRTLFDGRRPQKIKAESGEKALVETISQAGVLIAPVFLYLVSRSAPVKTLLPGAAKALGLTTPTTLDGVAVDVITVDVETKDGRARLTFSVGKDDHLLRRLEVSTLYERQNLTLIESYTKVKANPTVDAKTFRLAP